ncbi:MAG TPA: hypothetical protein VFO77_04305, partial [Actinoplanes sp.]|nr:hypothetical protein [Actinoplanes sp.]
TGDSAGVSADPFDPSGTYVYAASLVALGALGLLYVLAGLVKAASVRRRTDRVADSALVAR